MKRILTLANNEFKIYFSERSSLIFFLLLPAIFTAVIGVGLSGMSSGAVDPDADQRIAIALVDEDQGSMAGYLIESFAESNVIRTVVMDRERAFQHYDEDDIPAIVILPQGISEQVRQAETTEINLHLRPDSTAARAVREEVSAILTRAGGIQLAAEMSSAHAAELRPFADAEEVQAYFEEGLALNQELHESPPLQVKLENASQNSSNLVAIGFTQSSPGNVVTWTLFTFLGSSVVLVDERRNGTLRRLLFMPMHKSTILAGKLLGRMGMGLLQMLVLIVLGALAFNVDWGQSPLALSMLCLSFGLAATTLGLFLAAISRTVRQANSLTTIISLTLAALGGAWWPMEITPSGFQSFVQILPSTWAMRGFTDIILRGQGPAGILLETMVLLGFALVFFLAGIWRFRYE